MRTSPLLLGVLATALPYTQAAANPFELASNAGKAVVRGVLSNVLGFNETKVDKIMNTDVPMIPAHPYALDLNDTNWETAIRTGTYNPLAAPLDKDTVWIIHVYGPDALSRQFGKAFDDVALYNSSQAGGELPKNFRFARIDYGTETVLPTRWWMWKPPMLVIASDNLRTLRFFTPFQVPPQHEAMSNLIAARDFWDTLQPWSSPLAPGGALEPVMFKVADGWSWYHQYISKVPNWVLLAFSGFLMNIVVSWFHKPENAAKQLEEQRAIAAAKLAKETAEAEAKAAAEKKKAEEAIATAKKAETASTSEEEDSAVETSAKATGVRRGKARAAKRK